MLSFRVFILLIIFTIMNLEWLYYIWTLTKKIEKEYTNKENQKAVNYRIKFEFLWWYELIECSKDFYDILEEWKFYALNIWKNTRKDIDFVNLYVKSKDWKSYEIDWEELILLETN